MIFESGFLGRAKCLKIHEKELVSLVIKFVDFSDKMRRNGKLILIKEEFDEHELFLKSAVELLTDHITYDLLIDILKKKVHYSYYKGKKQLRPC